MAKAKKFGLFGGVFTPSILTLLGVIMYMRLPWITGQIGLWSTLAIIFVAHIVSGSTGLSVASIATDKRVESGGTYYIISRSLGLPIGGTLGWALFFGLSLSVSLYLIGFSEVFLDLLGYETTLDNIRIMGTLVLFAVLVITFISTSLTIKTQYLILSVMILSLLSIFLGGGGEYMPAEPALHSLPEALPWITLFAIFFPAVTGFEAGVAMSGDLKDAKKAIPQGTILAIVTALVIYVGLAVFFSFKVDRNLLIHDPQALYKSSLVPQLVIAGVLGATLSSALGSILGAPRILQAVANDKIAPSFLGRGFGPSNEPRNALIFSYLIAQGGILIGELNAIARVVTIFFIITYGFLNITYAVESWSSSDFRPTFKIPKIVSIIGAIACIVLMIQLDILALAVAAVLLTSLFLYLRKKEFKLSSGDSRESLWLSLVKMGLLKLTKSESKDRNWRPNIVLFSGGASKRPHLVQLAKELVGKLGIFTNFELVKGDPLTNSTSETILESLDSGGEVITRRHSCQDLYEGIGIISSVYGFSGFEPNMVLMGWPQEVANNREFENLVGNLLKQDYNIALLKHNSKRGFGERKRVDILWRGEERTLPLALHLAASLFTAPKWRRAKLRVIVVLSNAGLSELFIAEISKLLKELRIEATTKVVISSHDSSIIQVVKENTLESDLVITDLLGIREDLSSALERADAIANAGATTLCIHADSTFEPIKLPQLLSQLPIKNETNLEAEVACKQEVSQFLEPLIEGVTQEWNQLSTLYIHLESARNDRAKELRELLASEIDNGQLIDQISLFTSELYHNILGQLNLQLMDGVERYLKAILALIDKLPKYLSKHRVTAAVEYYIYTPLERELVALFDAQSSANLTILSFVRGAVEESQKLQRFITLIDALDKEIEESAARTQGVIYKITNNLEARIKELKVAIDTEPLNHIQRKYSKIINRESRTDFVLEEYAQDSYKEANERATLLKFDIIFYNLFHKLKTLLNIELAKVEELLSQEIIPYFTFEKIERELLNLFKTHKFSFEQRFDQLNSGAEYYLALIDENIEISLESGSHKIPLRKLSYYHISNQFLANLESESQEFLNLFSNSIDSLDSIIKLASYTSKNFTTERLEASQVEIAQQDTVEKIKTLLLGEQSRLEEGFDKLKQNLEVALSNSFSPLNHSLLFKKGENYRVNVVRGSNKSLASKLKGGFKKVATLTEKLITELIFKKSEGVLWASQITQAADNHSGSNRVSNPVLDQLPFYYNNLFTGRSGSGEEFWIAREKESERGTKAISRFKQGESGLILISGQRRCGKSTLSRHLAESHFDSSEIFYLSSPKECCSNLSLFEKELSTAICGQERELDSLFTLMENKIVVVLEDLELWWERKEGGDVVVKRVIDLVKYFGNKVLFMVNINSNSLEILDAICSIRGWALANIECSPFSAKELKELILARHHAGGLKLFIDKKAESEIREWEYARLFSKFFDISAGNPGYAIYLWLNSINDISGDVIFLSQPQSPGVAMVEGLEYESALILQQFVLHRRFSIDRLASQLKSDAGMIRENIIKLLQKGLLKQKYPGIYSINPLYVPAIVNELQIRELL